MSPQALRDFRTSAAALGAVSLGGSPVHQVAAFYTRTEGRASAPVGAVMVPVESRPFAGGGWLARVRVALQRLTAQPAAAPAAAQAGVAA
jgi:hypothetical protein